MVRGAHNIFSKMSNFSKKIKNIKKKYKQKKMNQAKDKNIKNIFVLDPVRFCIIQFSINLGTANA